MNTYYTLITGGSSGIGKALAFECARRNMNLVLVSRPSSRLTNTAGEIASSFSVSVKYFGADLAESGAAEKVYEWCRSQGIKVNFLINNAGVTGTEPFDKNDPEYIERMINVNIRAVVVLTRLFLPMLKETKGSRILNIGSLSGYFPVPYKSVYSASKAFVHNFSRSIAAELEDYGIRVHVANPNGVDSNPLTAERISKHRLLGKMVKLSPERFAELTLDRVLKGKQVYIPRFFNRLLVFISRLLPDRAMTRIIKNEFGKELK